MPSFLIKSDNSCEGFLSAVTRGNVLKPSRNPTKPMAKCVSIKNKKYFILIFFFGYHFTSYSLMFCNVGLNYFGNS